MPARVFSSRGLLLGSAVLVVAAGVGVIVSRGAFPSWHESGQRAAEGEWTCPMHPDVHESHPGRCPICGMTLERKSAAASAEAHGEAHESRAEATNPARPGVVAPPADDIEPREAVTIDGRRQQLLGVRVARAESATLERTLRLPAVVKFDESTWNTVTVRMEGYVRDLYVDRTGQSVRQGQPLFSVYSPDIAEALAEYRIALQAEKALAGAPGEARDDSSRLVAAAALRLQRWGISPDQAETADHAEPNTVFRSPVSGVVMEKTIVRGMRAMPGDVLYRIVDPSRVWIEASVYEPDLTRVAVGQRGTVRVGALPGEAFNARISYIAPGLDAESRTAAVRFELPNRSGRLKAGMFASVDLKLPLGRGLVVPADAVLDSGRRQIVFVSRGRGYFEPREVTIGERLEGRVQIVSGLTEGEEVAESAAFFIDSESQLRAATRDYAGSSPSVAAPATGAELGVQLTVSPDPLKAGPAQLSARILGADGTPLDDVSVKVVFGMAAMPSMNMPAMHAEALLAPSGGGRYLGRIDVPTAGRWDVTVSVSRGAERLGGRQLTLIAH